MRNHLALFDLDHTLLPIDSDYEWGSFLTRIGAVDPVEYEKRNAEFYEQYKAGTLDPKDFLEFVLGTLSGFSRQQLDGWHEQFMAEVIRPVMLPPAFQLLEKHREQGDLIVIVTATNRFITEPIARAFGVKNLIAALPEEKPDGSFTGKLVGIPTSGKGKITHTENWLALQGKSLGSYEKSYFYSDSYNDLPLLLKVTHPVATNPDTRLESHAKANNWTLLRLFDD
ncbi:HAD-IB family hydrolase [Oxalobacter vibrioformis]|uniref:HAD-IB family hydrolase n=1 Tax=Oxalobacter vibrioformis TaxID=933080 RepID=A0A9E9M0K4_9BURK|nr:HAD family hydrolase [Oxalobacter vibrioformis]WAW10974.1 HAD-IB family hydrolase [Oxalobacter vibrioformis]